MDELKSICKDVMCASHHGLWRKAWLCDSVWHMCDSQCVMVGVWHVLKDVWIVCVSVCEELFCSIKRPAFYHILMIPHPAELSIFFIMSDISVQFVLWAFSASFVDIRLFVICPVKLIQYFLIYLDENLVLKLWL